MLSINEKYTLTSEEIDLIADKVMHICDLIKVSSILIGVLGKLIIPEKIISTINRGFLSPI